MKRIYFEYPDAISALSNGEIKGRPCGHAWLVCLSSVSMATTSGATGLHQIRYKAYSGHELLI